MATQAIVQRANVVSDQISTSFSRMSGNRASIAAVLGLFALTSIAVLAESSPAYAHAQQVTTPLSRNHGVHVLHMGGSYDSYLLVPEIPTSKN
jgi:hypothetical protein